MKFFKTVHRQTVSQPALDSAKSSFIIGVTGHMDLDPAYREQIKIELQRIFHWICDRSVRSDQVLDNGLGLADTPLILLSSLAPGADQWVVEAAREFKHPPGLRILAPLPFAKEQYLKASTFQKEGAAMDEMASRFLAEFPDQDTFVVRLSDETELDDNALRKKHEAILTGLSGKSERNRRYAAAGEYVAAYCDILIALTDKPLGQAEDMSLIRVESPGARAVAELKRRGITPDLLPILPSLSWADNGPVLHLFATRKKEPASGGGPTSFQMESPENGQPVERLEMLYPYDSRPVGVSETEDTHPAWRSAGHAFLKVLAEHLQRLNTETIPNDPREEAAEREAMLAWRVDGLNGSQAAETSAELSAASELLTATLDRVARLRRRVANYSLHCQARFKSLKRALFALAFSVTLFFSLAENWDVPSLGWPLRQVFLVLALAATMAAWITFFRFKRVDGADERYNDYRALAEGLRVQFYWTACGSGQSVASHYLQRQRGELSWIRNTISSAAFPYEPHRIFFRQLPRARQRAVLQSIRIRWIDEQSVYFKNEIESLTRQIEFYSTYSAVLVCTGFTLQALLLFPPGGFDLSRPMAWPILAIGAFILGGLFLRARAERRTHPGRSDFIESSKRQGHPAKLKTRGQTSRFSKPGYAWAAGILPERIESFPGGRPVLIFLLTISFSLLILGAIGLLGNVAPWVPKASKLGGLCKNLALAGGVLCGAWAGVNFFEENLRRYDSMASLFQSAGRRFDDHFALLERVPAERRAAAEEGAIANVQDLLVAVGREALSESAEWLITHRIRPVEPVSAY